MSDLQPVAALQPVRAFHARAGIVQEGAVARDVVEPVAALLVADFAVSARDDAIGIRQAPVEMLLAADLEAAPARLVTHRAAVGQLVEILDPESDRHSLLVVVANLAGAGLVQAGPVVPGQPRERSIGRTVKKCHASVSLIAIWT